MDLLVLWMCFLAITATIADNEDCTLNTCHVLNTFKEELESIKRQILTHDEDVEYKKLERRLRSLEQTSTFYLSQFNNKIAINFIVISVDNFIC